MKRTRPPSRILTTAFLLGGLAAAIGCGSHPEEGMLKLPARKGEAPAISKAEPTKAATPGRKNRKAAEEAAGGK